MTYSSLTPILRFCPYCGAYPKLSFVQHGSKPSGEEYHQRKVKCPDCGVRIDGDICPTDDEAVMSAAKKWNRRETRIYGSIILHEYSDSKGCRTCSNCGHLLSDDFKIRGHCPRCNSYLYRYTQIRLDLGGNLNEGN